MKEIGIQYSAPMVRAVLNGSKAVTRRTVKGEIPAGAGRAVFEPVRVGGKPAWRWLDAQGGPLGKPFRSPYGVAGDRLWVREAWRTGKGWDALAPREVPDDAPVSFEADGLTPMRLDGKFRPGMFMPRWASRIDLEVTGVACERLQDITPQQAIAEGIESNGNEWRDYSAPLATCMTPRGSFRSLWNSLNGDEAWDENPWVFAISFRRHVR